MKRSVLGTGARECCVDIGDGGRQNCPELQAFTLPKCVPDGLTELEGGTNINPPKPERTLQNSRKKKADKKTSAVLPATTKSRLETETKKINNMSKELVNISEKLNSLDHSIPERRTKSANPASACKINKPLAANKEFNQPVRTRSKAVVHFGKNEYNVPDYTDGIDASQCLSNEIDMPRERSKYNPDVYFSELAQGLAENYDKVLMQLVRHKSTVDAKTTVQSIRREIQKWRNTRTTGVSQETENIPENDNGTTIGMASANSSPRSGSDPEFSRKTATQSYSHLRYKSQDAGPEGIVDPVHQIEDQPRKMDWPAGTYPLDDYLRRNSSVATNKADAAATDPTSEKKNEDDDLKVNRDLLKKTDVLLKRAESEWNAPLFKARLSPKEVPKSNSASWDDSENDYYTEKMVEAEFYKSTTNLPKVFIRHRVEGKSEAYPSSSFVPGENRPRTAPTLDTKQRSRGQDRVPSNPHRRLLTVERMNAQRLVSEKLKKPDRRTQPPVKFRKIAHAGEASYQIDRRGDEFPMRQSSSVARQNNFMSRHNTQFCSKQTTRSQYLTENRVVNCQHCQLAENHGDSVFKCKQQKYACKNKEDAGSVQDLNFASLEKFPQRPRAGQEQSGLTMKDLETEVSNPVNDGAVASGRRSQSETPFERVAAKKLDAATNTDVLVEPRTNTEVQPEPKPNTEVQPQPKPNTEVQPEPRNNTAVITVVSRRSEDDQESETSVVKETTGLSMRVQHLPKMNIRPELTRQLGASVDIPTAVEEFAKRDRNNVAVFNFVHGPVREPEKFHYASDESTKGAAPDEPNNSKDGSTDSSCSLCRICSECGGEKMAETGQNLHDAAVSLSGQLDGDCDQGVCEFKEALASLARSLHGINSQRVQQMLVLSREGKSRSYISSRMRLVADLLEKELENGPRTSDHYTNLNNLIKRLISDMQSENLIYEQRRKNRSRSPKTPASNAGVSSGIRPSSSNHHQELKKPARPFSSHLKKNLKKPKSSEITNQLEESGMKELPVTKNKQVTQLDGEITLKIPSGESYAKHSIKKPEVQSIPYRHLLPSNSKKPVIPDVTCDLKQETEKIIDTNPQPENKCESPITVKDARSKDDVPLEKLNETFSLTGEGDETEASSQSKILTTHHVSKEASDNDYDDDWESDEELNTSENIIHSIKNEGSITAHKSPLNSSEVELNVEPSNEISSVSVEHQKSKENVREPNGNLEPSKQNSVFKQNIDKNVDTINTDWVKCSKERVCHSHESCVEKRTQNVLSCLDLNAFSQSIEASSVVKNFTVLKNLSLNDNTKQTFRLDDFSKIIDEIKNNCLSENKMIEYVNERIEKCLSKRLENRSELSSESDKMAGCGDHKSDKTSDSNKNCRTKLEIQLSKLSNPLDGIVSISQSGEQNEIKLSLTMPELVPELLVESAKRFPEQCPKLEVPQLSHSSSHDRSEMVLKLANNCSRSTMTENINQDASNQTQVESSLTENIATSMLKDVLEGKINNVFEKYESKTPTCHHSFCFNSPGMAGTIILPNPVGAHSLHNCCTDRLQVKGITSLSQYDKHNKENVQPVEKPTTEDTVDPNCGPLQIQNSDVKCLMAPGVSLSVVNCSKVQSKHESKEISSIDVNNEIVETHRLAKALKVFLKPTDKIENECDIKCDLTLSTPRDMLRINTNAASDNSQIFNKANQLPIPNDLPLENKMRGKIYAAGISLVKITTSFDIPPENNLSNEAAVEIEGHDRLFGEHVDDSFDLVPGAIQQPQLEHCKSGHENDNFKTSNNITSPRNTPDNNKRVNESITNNLDQETIPNVKKQNNFYEDNFWSDLAELSSIKSSENRANIGVPYYDTDNMSDGEVGYASTYNSYSSGEIKPRHHNQTGNSSDSSLSSMNVDDLNEDRICETLSKIGLNLKEVEQNSDSLPGPVRLIESDQKPKENSIQRVHRKLNKSKDKPSDISKDLAHGEVSCSDFEIPTESGSDDSGSDLNITHLMKLLHDCKSSFTDSGGESSGSQNLPVAETSPVK